MRKCVHFFDVCLLPAEGKNRVFDQTQLFITHAYVSQTVIPMFIASLHLHLHIMYDATGGEFYINQLLKGKS